MDRLPQELLRLIVADVAYKSLEPLRLVNKALAAAAAPFLFEVIPLWIGVRSLERLTAISEHPQLSQYPKHIIFSPVRFIDYESDSLYKDKVQDWLEYLPASLSMHALTLAKHMSAYRSYIEAQRLLSSKALDGKILSRAFSQLPHLEILHMDFCDTTIGSAELIHAFGAFKAEDLLTCDCCHTLPVLVLALAVSPIKIKVFKLGKDTNSSYSSISGSVGDYSTAASHARPRRSTSMTSFQSWPAGISTQALSKTFDVENLHIFSNALRDVRELKFGRMSVGRGDPANLSRTVVALRNLMRFAFCLETVTLERICSLFLKDLTRPTIDSVMPDHGLCNLKKIKIHYYNITIVFLSDFFFRHANTIVEAEFHVVAIIGSDWSTALMQLRTLVLPRLEVFILSNHVEEEVGIQGQDYILKKTDKDPIVERKEWLERAREREMIGQHQQAPALITA